jgi:hypothetical protein
MEFEWLESRRTSGAVNEDAWIRSVSEKAGLLARLNHKKSYALKRCEQNLNWSFGDKKAWPITAAALKKAVNAAYRSAGVS